jgi:hypothetical protein
MLAWVMDLGFAASDSGFVPPVVTNPGGTFLMLGVGACLALVTFLG